MTDRVAIIDLGTNTFHLYVVEIAGGKSNTLYREKIAVKIGKNGISKGKIAPDAKKRAIHTLKIFRTVIDLFEVKHIRGVATSAIRSAKNGPDLIKEIRERTKIEIDIISGNEEAGLIFKGVQAAMKIPDAPQLVVDIGGGSVEFIIGNQQGVLWKQSFEMGAQRLLDKFHQTDPIPAESAEALQKYLAKNLKDLTNAIVLHQPEGVIGCSGTFDTLVEIYLNTRGLERNPEEKIHLLPASAFKSIHQDMVHKNRDERLKIPGMVTMRADMIVVACCLIDFVLDQTQSQSITACSYALKEGLLYASFEELFVVNEKVPQ